MPEHELTGETWKANLNPEFIADFERRLGFLSLSDGKGDLRRTFGPEDVFDYIYAVLYSPTYRARYAEFLINVRTYGSAVPPSFAFARILPMSLPF